METSEQHMERYPNCDLRDARETASQVSANAALVPESKRPGIVDDAKGRDGRHQQYTAEDQEDACGASLRHLQDDQSIARGQ